MILRRIGGIAAAVCLCATLDTASAGSRSYAAPPKAAAAGAASNPVKPHPNIAKQRDGTLLIAGRSLRCGTSRNVLDPHLPNLGLAAPGVVVFNPRELNRWPDTVRLFVFHHECGHHHVGGDELGADCWAVKQGVRQGWLDRDGLVQVCRSFGGGPATSTHPAAAARCAALNRCFSAAMTVLAKEKAAAPIEAQAPKSDAPKLVQEPTLKRSGMRPGPDEK